jgi:hypothetical protein
MHYNLTKVREIEAKLYGVYINVIAKVRRGEYVGGPGMGNTSVAPEATYGEGILGGPGPYAQNNIRGVKDYVIPTDQFTQIAQQLTPNYADSLNFGGESDDSLPTGAGMANFVPPIMLSTAVAAYVILLMF